MVVLVVVIVAEVSTLAYINSLSLSLKRSLSEPSAYNYWLKKKPIMTTSTKIDVSEGIITAIDAKGGNVDVNGINYTYALKIELKNRNGAIYSFVYDSNDLEKTTISSNSGKLSVSALTVGDNLIIKETIDLLRTNSAVISVDIKKK